MSDIEDLIKRLNGKYSCGPEGILEDRDFGSYTPAICKEAAKVITEQKKVIQEAMEVVKAVAHVGVDFGYGKYELEPEKIDLARKLYEQTMGENNG